MFVVGALTAFLGGFVFNAETVCCSFCRLRFAEHLSHRAFHHHLVLEAAPLPLVLLVAVSEHHPGLGHRPVLADHLGRADWLGPAQIRDVLADVWHRYPDLGYRPVLVDHLGPGDRPGPPAFDV